MNVYIYKYIRAAHGVHHHGASEFEYIQLSCTYTHVEKTRSKDGKGGAQRDVYLRAMGRKIRRQKESVRDDDSSIYARQCRERVLVTQRVYVYIHFAKLMYSYIINWDGEKSVAERI